MKIAIKNLFGVWVFALSMKVACWAFDIMSEDVQNELAVDAESFLTKLSPDTLDSTASQSVFTASADSILERAD